MTNSSRGTMVDDGEHATLVFERTLRHPIEHVWDAIATPDGLAAWLLGRDVRIDGRVGGTIAMVSGAGGYRSTFLDRLEAQLAGRPLPDWMHRFEALLSDYPAWSHA